MMLMSDEISDTEAWEKALKYKRVVGRMLHKHYTDLGCQKNPAISVKDLEQAGMIGMFYAAKNFDITKGKKFEYYAEYYVKKHIGTTFAFEGFRTVRVPHTSEWRAKNEPEKNKELGEKIKRAKQAELRLDSDEVHYTQCTYDTNLGNVCNVIDIENFVKTFTPKRQEIICSLYGIMGRKKIGPTEIAKKLGTSVNYVKHQRGYILHEMRRYNDL